MPLYSNILLSKKNNGDTGEGNPSLRTESNASMRLLHDHLLSKRRLQQQDLPHGKQVKDKSQVGGDLRLSQVISETDLHRPSENEWEQDDEYDPMAPNNYELLQAEYIQNTKNQSAHNTSKVPQTSSSKKTVSNLLQVLDALDEKNDIDLDLELDKKPMSKGIAIAPPASLVTSSSVPPPSLSKVAKDSESDTAETKAITTTTNPVEPKDLSTRVLLLQNMVGPGEVDDDLEGETKEECKKYGDVIRCLIYEIPNKQVPDEEAVRIFIEFRKVESATKAKNDLNGRYFGGRVVRAAFYSQEKFSKYELGA